MIKTRFAIQLTSSAISNSRSRLLVFASNLMLWCKVLLGRGALEGRDFEELPALGDLKLLLPEEPKVDASKPFVISNDDCCGLNSILTQTQHSSF